MKKNLMSSSFEFTKKKRTPSKLNVQCSVFPMLRVLYYSVVREMVIRDHSSVNDEDEDSNTALHLATLHGHTKVALILIKNGADVAAR